MFTDINIYPMNNKTDHISEKNIFFIEKKVKQKLIYSRSDLEQIPDPYQNETNPQHLI